MNNLVEILAVKSIILVLSLEELEEGCEAYLDDINNKEELGTLELLFPHLIHRKLELYEAEY